MKSTPLLIATIAFAVPVGLTALGTQTAKPGASIPASADEDCNCESTPFGVEGMLAFVQGQGVGGLGRRQAVPASSNSLGTAAYSAWFQQHSIGVYPSPFGSFAEEVEFREGSFSADVNPKGGAKVNTSGGERAQSVVSSFRGSATVDLIFPKLFIDPKVDGATERLFGRLLWRIEGVKQARLWLIVKTNNGVIVVGAPHLGGGGNSAWTPIELTHELAKLKDRVDLSCKAEPFTLGVRIEPVGEMREATISVKEVALGTLATCCPQFEVAKPPSRESGRNPRIQRDSRIIRDRIEQSAGKSPVKKACCDDSELESKVTVGRNGNAEFEVTLPANADADFEPFAEIVDFDGGDVNDWFGGIDTRSTTWLDQFPCEKAIGGLSERDLASLVLKDPDFVDEDVDLEEMGKVSDSLVSLHQGKPDCFSASTALRFVLVREIAGVGLPCILGQHLGCSGAQPSTGKCSRIDKAEVQGGP